MAPEEAEPKASSEEAVLQAQYLRSLSSFEGIMLAQIEMKTQLSNRLNWTIRAGLILLGVIAFSLLILLLTLSSQINRISAVVLDINGHFESITDRLDRVTIAMGEMEKQVALMGAIDMNTQVMDREMAVMQSKMREMGGEVNGIQIQLGAVKDEMGGISSSISAMNSEVGIMRYEIRRMAKPARSMNRILPFP